jgi:hypothetical protein
MDWSRRAMLHSGASAGVAALGARRGETAAAATRGDGGSQDVHWESVHRDLCNSGRDPDSRVPDQNISVALETDGGYRNGSFVLFDEDKIVIAERNESNVEAYDRQSGNKLWSFGGGTVRHAPTIGNDVFYFSGGDGTIYRLDKDGNKTGENKVISAAGTYFFNNCVLAITSLAEVTLFDETLSESAIYERPGDVAFAFESLTIDEQGRAIYVERRQGGSPDTHLRMLELPDDPAETDSLTLVDKVPVGGEAEDGATLYEGNYIWNEGQTLQVAEVRSDGFGAVHGVTVGEFEGAPVVIDGDIWAGTSDGDVYRVPLADIKSDGSADVEIIDNLDTGIVSVVAGAETVVVGSVGRKATSYDKTTGERVQTYTAVENGLYRKPVAVDDGKLFMARLDGGDSIEVLEGDYRELGPDITGYSVEYSGIVGDSLTAEVSLADPASEVEYAWAIRDADGTPVQQSSGAPTWEITPALEVGETYEVAVEVTFQGVTERRETTITPAPPPLVGDTPPQDHDGDGLYEDIRGTGEATVLDTQALFEALEDGGAQEYPQAFDFSGASPDGEVTILDVAAHWRSHAARE